MNDPLYLEEIMDHYRNPHNFGTLADADVRYEDSNPLCGDQIQLSLRFTEGRLHDIKFQGQGCAISVASASMLTDALQGKQISEIMRLNDQ